MFITTAIGPAGLSFAVIDITAHRPLRIVRITWPTVNLHSYRNEIHVNVNSAFKADGTCINVLTFGFCNMARLRVKTILYTLNILDALVLLTITGCLSEF